MGRTLHFRYAPLSIHGLAVVVIARGADAPQSLSCCRCRPDFIADSGLPLRGHDHGQITAKRKFSNAEWRLNDRNLNVAAETARFGYAKNPRKPTMRARNRATESETANNLRANPRQPADRKVKRVLMPNLESNRRHRETRRRELLRQNRSQPKDSAESPGTR